MRFRRRFNRALARLLMAALLFAQLATAAYACPASREGGSAAARVEMPGCDGHMGDAPTIDHDLPLLCHAHCQPDAQNVHPTPTTDAPLSSVLWAVLDWAAVALLPASLEAARPALSSGAPPPGSPPRYLTLLVLRN